MSDPALELWLYTLFAFAVGLMIGCLMGDK